MFTVTDIKHIPHPFISKLLKDIGDEKISLEKLGLNKDSFQVSELISARNNKIYPREQVAKSISNILTKTTISNEQLNNIELLKKSNTYTVTTGHQLQIFGGPLFFIYKIASTIAYSQHLKERYPQDNFVPIFWMATEDHDFEEISSVNLFGSFLTTSFDR